MDNAGTRPDAATVAAHREAGVAWLVVRNPPVNALGHEVRRALREALEAARSDPHAAAVAIASDGPLFSGGGDLLEIGRPERSGGISLGDLAEAIEAFPKPVVAALQGKAIGGGVLLAMACHARVGAHDAQLGLPEVNLGFVPGAGGTQRLPRLVGVEAALRMVALARPLRAEAALAAGLLDVVVPEGGSLRVRAAAHALAIAHGRLPWRRTAALAVPGGAAPEALVARYRTLAAERFGDREAAQQAVSLIARAAEQPFARGVLEEREAYRQLAASSQTRALVAAFLAGRAAVRGGGTGKHAT